MVTFKHILLLCYLSASSLIISFSPVLNAQNWNLTGTEIKGAALDQLGYSLDLSNDGTTMIVGSPTYTKIINGNFEYDLGNVKIFQRSGDNWNQMGTAIEGDNFYEQLGYSVSIDGNGSTVVVGAPFNDEQGEAAGKVKIYRRIGNSWVRKGNPIFGLNSQDRFGSSVKLSADGNLLAVSAPLNSTAANRAGQVIIYEWTSGAWQQKGAPINGELEGDRAGSSLDISNDGNTLIMGLPFNDATGDDAGRVEVFQWDGQQWTSKGNGINGLEARDNFGHALSISGDGNVVAVGAPNHSAEFWKDGQVQVFEWNGASWMERGEGLIGEVFEDRFGQTVSLSSDGQSLVVGMPLKNAPAFSEGQVRVYDFTENEWQQRGDPLNGELIIEKFGSAVSISDNRSVLAVGAPGNNAINTQNGQVSVFEWDTPLGVFANDTDSPISCYPNPFQNNFHIALDKNYAQVNVEIKNLYGQAVANYTFLNQRNLVLQLDQPAGIYFVVLTAAAKPIAKLKVMKF